MALASGAVLVAFGVIAGFDLYRANGLAQALYSVDVRGVSVEGDLQYFTQESRRLFLFAFTTVDPNRQLPYIRETRVADGQVDRLVRELAGLDLDPETRNVVTKFSAQWQKYGGARDEVIALILEGNTAEAVGFESAHGAPEFEKVRAVMRTLKQRLDQRAARKALMVGQAFFRAGTELSMLFVSTLVFIAGVMRANSEKRRALVALNDANGELTRAQSLEVDRNRILELVGIATNCLGKRRRNASDRLRESPST